MTSLNKKSIFFMNLMMTLSKSILSMSSKSLRQLHLAKVFVKFLFRHKLKSSSETSMMSLISSLGIYSRFYWNEFKHFTWNF